MNIASIEEILQVAVEFSIAWGREAIRIAVPQTWRDLEELLPEGELRLLEFTTETSICVRAVVAGKTMVEFSADAFAVLDEIALRTT